MSSSQSKQMSGLLLFSGSPSTKPPAQPRLTQLRLRFNSTSTFLGVTSNCTFSFTKHVSLLKAKFFSCYMAYAVSLLPHGAPPKSLSLFCIKLFFGPFSLRWFPFFSVTNISKLEHLHQAASCAIIGCFSSSSIPLLFSKASLPPLQVTLTHFTFSSYERALCLPTSFSISGLARQGVKLSLYRDPCGELLCSFTCSCFLLLLLGRLSLPALPFLLGTCLPSLWSPPFPPHTLALIPLLFLPRCSSRSP